MIKGKNPEQIRQNHTLLHAAVLHMSVRKPLCISARHLSSANPKTMPLDVCAARHFRACRPDVLDRERLHAGGGGRGHRREQVGRGVVNRLAQRIVPSLSHPPACSRLHPCVMESSHFAFLRLSSLRSVRRRARFTLTIARVHTHSACNASILRHLSSYTRVMSVESIHHLHGIVFARIGGTS
jgi:hypothetical protein